MQTYILTLLITQMLTFTHNLIDDATYSKYTIDAMHEIYAIEELEEEDKPIFPLVFGFNPKVSQTISIR